MVTRKILINTAVGLHLRPAGRLCQKAMEYQSRIEFTYKDVHANAKSVLSLLSACVPGGSEIELSCEGEDEEKAMKELSELIEQGLE